MALPTKALQSQGHTAAAVTQSSAAVLSKIPHNTSPVAAITASAVSNTVLASVTACGNTVGLDSGGEIGASGGGVAGLGGGPNIAQTMPTTTSSSSMEKSDIVSATNVPDSTSGAFPTSSPKLLRPAVFDKVC